MLESVVGYSYYVNQIEYIWKLCNNLSFLNCIEREEKEKWIWDGSPVYGEIHNEIILTMIQLRSITYKYINELKRPYGFRISELAWLFSTKRHDILQQYGYPTEFETNLITRD